LSLDEWNSVLAVNLAGPFLCSKYSEKELRKNKGAIVNICSTRALQSEANTEAYSASKGGLLALTHALAMSFSPEVRVNAISPGWVDVSAVKKKSAAKQTPLSAEDHRQHPAGRVGKAEDIANMVLFLFDSKNDFITGQNFVIDGGMSKKMIYR
jgi:NAD(P)-dependent dehydrogenase (short-subunit alcohol dehydrogenase family)